MTIREAAEKLISARPHVARWLAEIASGARQPGTAPVAYLTDQIGAAARAQRAHRQGGVLREAADVWSRRMAPHEQAEACNALIGEALEAAQTREEPA